MPKVRVSGFTISTDGFGAGPEQSLENPLGVGGSRLHRWLLPTATFQGMLGQPDGTAGTDDEFARAGMEGVGAWIMGRNMFGPFAAPGPMTDGRGGGVTSRPIAFRSSYSPTILGSRWR